MIPMTYNASLTLRVSKAQYQELARAAKKNKKPLSVWAREVLILSAEKGIQVKTEKRLQ